MVAAHNDDVTCNLNKTFCFISNMSILHLNICSSQHKLTDLSYYLENLNVPFSFIGISETWATKYNNHILNIPTYHPEQCVRSNNKKGGGTSVYINKDIQYKNRNDLSFPKQHYESIIIEVDKSIFNTNHNTIIGEIYRPPSSKLNNFNIELEKILIKINKESMPSYLVITM